MCVYIVEYKVTLLEEHGKRECMNYYCLYLPTQIRFPVGIERVMCRWSKLTNPLRKQHIELSTRT